MNINKKLKDACEILSRENIGDFDPLGLVGMVRNGQVTRKQVYGAMFHFGYRWHGGPVSGGWRLSIPAWLATARKHIYQKEKNEV